MDVKHWMSWEAGVDLVAMTEAGLPGPNLILHVARMVHTPVGSAPAGMVLFQPDPNAAPKVMAFVSSNIKVATYFGPHIFAGTPFERAPALEATIDIAVEIPERVRSVIKVAGHTFETTLSKFRKQHIVHRISSEHAPFVSQGVETTATHAEVTLDGKPLKVILPNAGPNGGPPALWAPCGTYAR